MLFLKLFLAGKFIAAHQVYHHIVNCNYIIPPRGLKERHLVYTGKQYVPLEYFICLTFCYVVVLLALISELAGKAEVY